MARGDLFLARDQLGVKPLYYAEVARGFLFGSEMKALLRCADLPRSIDATALHYMLAYTWTPAPRTMLEAVRKLEPGAALLVHAGRVSRRWSFYTVPYDGSRSLLDEGMLAGELAGHVQTAVRRQLVADVPVGAFLSGGLDSSAVVAMMRRALPEQRITCFTMAFSGDDGDDGMRIDLPYARLAASHLGVDLQEVAMDAGAIGRLGEMVYLLDEPQADPAPINALMIAEQARAMGIPVLLSGAGGDDLFGGYRRHWALSFERRWAWLPQSVRAGVQSLAAGAASGRSRGQSNPLLRRAAKMFAYAGEGEDRRLVSYFWWSTEQVRRALYSDAFAQRTADADTAAPLLESLRQIPAEQDPLQRMLFLETRHFLPDHNLNYTDRAGMAAAVEVRVPLLDLDVVRFATRVPSAFKQRGRIGKALFKKAMEPFLPGELIYRPKVGFGAPLRRWLRHELRQTVDDTLAGDVVRRRGFFDAAAVRQLVAADRSGAVDGSYTIFALMCFELWCQRFVDPPERASEYRHERRVRMKQVLQELGSGRTILAEVPEPALTPGSVRILTRRSLISAGTERMLVEFSRANWLDRARQHPERVRQVLDKVRTDGVVATLEAVRSKLDQAIPLGYCNVGADRRLHRAGSAVGRGSGYLKRSPRRGGCGSRQSVRTRS